ncbi:MAG: TetR/AcrR family transcriptional regulator, partial [Rhodospirillaceae bacterium]|nr:TetR/AcrR family transcriptional regulator [Rhodospirillaceae bacterium]
YFPSKAEIFKAAVRETILVTVARLETMAEEFDGHSERLLERVISEMAQMVGGTQAGAIPKIILSEAGNFPDIAKFYVDEVVSRGLTVVSGIIARGQMRGEFAADLGPLTPFIVIAPILTLSVWNHGLGRVMGRPMSPDAFAEDVVRVIGRGLRKQEDVS